MGRKKLDLTYISDVTAREASFNSRKEELMQKLEEISVLCDVEVCAVIFKQSNPFPEVWPSNSGVRQILEKFEMLTEREKRFRSVNHEEFLKQEIEKARRKSKQLSEENKETYMRNLMFKCLNGNMEDLSLNDSDRQDLCNFIDQYVKKLIHHKNQTLNNVEIGESSSMAMAGNMSPTAMNAVMEPPAMAEAGSSSSMDPTILHSPELTDVLQKIISSDQIVAHDNSDGSVPQTSSNQEVYIPVMDQDESYNLNQNQNLEQGWVDEMIKIGEQTGFPWMEDNHSVDAEANASNVMFTDIQ